MKRLILFFAATLITAASATAQCTPDPQYTDPGVYPDSATGFPDGMVDCPYDLTITNVVPIDTTTMIGPIPVTLTFDSAVVTNVAGLPPGFTYSCYDAQNTVSPPDGCAFEGGTTGCISIVGTPQSGDEGVYNLSIDVDVYLEGGSTPTATQTVDYYTIEIVAFDPVNGCPPVGIEEETSANFTLYPNPVNESFTLKGLDGVDINSIVVSDATGKVVRTHDNVNESTFDVNVADLNEGVYFVTIGHANSSSVVRFIKE
ncbi:MAG: T9SS type A sorting domain-containing protein [Crocinitomicaceae bacterium]